MSADVVGYSRLVGMDEAGTLSRLNALRRELVDPAIADHSGRIVKLMGDGALVEFASAVDAVACAIEIQRQLREHDAGGSEIDSIRFRIGINVGDIIIEGEDILGGGACEPTSRYGVQISNAVVMAGDGGAAVQGRVSPGGAVSVAVQAGGQSASGSGHLNLARGRGVWRGQGSAGACQGRAGRAGAQFTPENCLL